MKTTISKLAAAIAFAAFSTAASASPEAWAEANAAYESQHFSKALEIYQQLAANGDVRAAELAGMMFAQGEKLYGDAVRRDTVRATQLFRQAAKGGSDTAQYLLARADVNPVVRTSAR
jgi:TPR repeat protein